MRYHSAESKLSLLWLTFLLGTAIGQQDGGTHGFLNFAQSQLVVTEGTGQTGFTSVQIPLVREGGVTGQVFAGLSVSDCKQLIYNNRCILLHVHACMYIATAI